MKYLRFLRWFIGALVIGSVIFYVTYLNPTHTENKIFEKNLEGVEVSVEGDLDKYINKSGEIKSDITLKGTQEDVEELSEHDPLMYIEPEEEEGQQDLNVKLDGYEDVAYDIKNKTVQLELEKKEAHKYKGKVVIQGEPEVEIEGVEIEEDIIAYIEEDDVGEVRVYIDASGIKEDTVLEGTVELVNVKEEVIEENVLEKEKVKVNVKVKTK